MIGRSQRGPGLRCPGVELLLQVSTLWSFPKSRLTWQREETFPCCQGKTLGLNLSAPSSECAAPLLRVSWSNCAMAKSVGGAVWFFERVHVLCPGFTVKVQAIQICFHSKTRVLFSEIQFLGLKGRKKTSVPCLRCDLPTDYRSKAASLRSFFFYFYYYFFSLHS